MRHPQSPRSLRRQERLLHAAIAVFVSAAVGCDLLFSFEARQGAPHGVDAASLDSGSPDARGQLGDGEHRDTVTLVDAMSGDTPSSGDSGVDAPPATDAAGGPDGGALGPCVAGTQPFTVSWAPTMVICELGSSSISQCGALSLCGTGWHLCLASEYQANGGSDNGTTGRYWIAGCARRNGVVLSSLDGVCTTSCALSPATAVPVQWLCQGGGGSLGWTSNNVGIVTDDACHHLGIDNPATAAFWAGWSVNYGGAGAVCCQ